MLKTVSIFIPAILFLALAPLASSQQSKPDAPRQEPKIEFPEPSESDFYKSPSLRADFKEVDVVAYVDIKERKLADYIGSGDCETDKGTGYCLYRLKAEVKEVYKGKITEKTIEFYTSPDMDYPKKHLLGERVVFLNWREMEIGEKKEKSLSAMENSTRWIENDVLKKMRKIARKR
jgi:hypothetical protein